MLAKTVCRCVKSDWSYNDARKDGMVFSVAELGLPTKDRGSTTILHFELRVFYEVNLIFCTFLYVSTSPKQLTNLTTPFTQPLMKNEKLIDLY